ncbi:unnamed protein product [Prorocentrum cordatum]|uniref:Uncharacterized protein n=1 Tax=Prorocentrum cordatum TaxID=2364126 RepID=A0ABN9XC19_9DINO|nr:unnamed protein product [Polarella glacialis]
MSAEHRIKAVELGVDSRARGPASAGGRALREAAQDDVARWRGMMPQRVAEQDGVADGLAALAERLSREPAGEVAALREFEHLAQVLDYLLQTEETRGSRGGDDDDVNFVNDIVEMLTKFQAQEGATPCSVARMMKDEFYVPGPEL